MSTNGQLLQCGCAKFQLVKKKWIRIFWFNFAFLLKGISMKPWNWCSNSFFFESLYCKIKKLIKKNLQPRQLQREHLLPVFSTHCHEANLHQHILLHLQQISMAAAEFGGGVKIRQRDEPCGAKSRPFHPSHTQLEAETTKIAFLQLSCSSVGRRCLQQALNLTH